MFISIYSPPYTILISGILISRFAIRMKVTLILLNIVVEIIERFIIS